MTPQKKPTHSWTPPNCLVVIGASAGGVTAIQKILKNLPRDFDLPIAITYHISPEASVKINLIFEASNGATLVEVEDKMPIQKNHVYFSAPGLHLLVGRDGRFALSQDELVCYSRPSIDVLFESAAQAFGRLTVGIILTGANQDGSAGLKAIADAGGYTMVQDPKEAECSLMPLHAIEKARPDLILPLDDIGVQLGQICQKVALRG